MYPGAYQSFLIFDEKNEWCPKRESFVYRFSHHFYGPAVVGPSQQLSTTNSSSHLNNRKSRSRERPFPRAAASQSSNSPNSSLSNGTGRESNRDFLGKYLKNRSDYKGLWGMTNRIWNILWYKKKDFIFKRRVIL